MRGVPVVPLEALPNRELLAPIAVIFDNYANVRSEADYEKLTLMGIDVALRLARTLPLEWVRSEIGPILDRVVANDRLLLHDRMSAAALSIWAHWNTLNAVAFLAGCLKQPSEHDRVRAVEILGQCTHDAVPHLPAMTALLDSKSESERLAAVKALERMGSDAANAARSIMALFRVEKSPKVRAAIISAVDTIGPEHFADFAADLHPPLTLEDVGKAFGRSPARGGAGSRAKASNVDELLALVRGGERGDGCTALAAQYLYNLGPESAGHIAAALVKESDDTAVIVLMRAAGMHADDGNAAVDCAAPLIISRLGYDMCGFASEVCIAADSALDAFGARAVPALISAAFGDGELQLQALDRLARMRRHAVEAKRNK